MPKNFFKKRLPSPERVKQNRALQFLGNVLHEPNLWHINRRSASRAFAIGLFWGCTPIPTQMVFAALFAVKFNANLPLSLALVWISNPLTYLPIFGFFYLVGTWLMGIEPQPLDYELSFAWAMEKLGEIGIPLVVGSLFSGVVLAIVGYFGIQLIWRISIVRKWEARKLAREQKSE